MDGPRFDELTKSLVAATPSRREALRRLAGGALATVFGGLALEEATAQQVGAEARTCGQVCDKKRPCQVGLRCGQESGECVAIPSTKKPCSNNGDCNAIETCSAKDKCINTTAGSCRECFKSGDCGGDERCRDGKCKPECRNNGDCGGNKRCKDGKCVKRN